jgi:hypothetical protein
MQGYKVLKRIFLFAILAGICSMFSGECVAQTEVSTSYEFNETDSTWQQQTRTDYENGSAIVVIEPPVHDSLFSQYIIVKGEEKEENLKKTARILRRDSIDLAKASQLLKEQTGKDFEETQSEKFFADFEGDWVLSGGELTVNLTFEKGKFWNEEAESFNVKYKDKESFLLRRFFENQIRFFKKNNRAFVGEYDEVEYKLKKESSKRKK